MTNELTQDLNPVSRLRKILTYSVLGVILSSFMFFGVFEYLNGNMNGNVIKVGKYGVSRTDFEEGVKRRRYALMSQFGGAITESLLNTPEFKKLVVTDITNNLIVRNYLDQNLGIEVTDELVNKYIKQDDQFKSDGIFQTRLLNNYIQQRNITMRSYKTEVREEIERKLFIESVQNLTIDAPLIKAIQDKLKKAINKERSVSIYKFNKGDLTKIDTSLDEIQKYYKANKEDFAIEEFRKVKMIDINNLVSSDDIKVDRKKVELLYREKYSDQIKKRWNFYHVVFDTEKQANKALQDMKKGKKFTAVANSYLGLKREDVEFRESDLGELPSRLAIEVRKLKKGQRSAVVQTDIGYHIVLVNDIMQPDVVSFASVSNELQEEIRKRKKCEIASEIANNLENELFTGSDLEVEISKINENIDVEESAIKLSDNKYSDEFKKAVFGSDDDYYSNLVRVDRCNFIAYKLVKINEKSYQSIDEVKDIVAKKVKEGKILPKLYSLAAEFKKKYEESRSKLQTYNDKKDRQIEVSPDNIKEDEVRTALSLIKEGAVSNVVQLKDKTGYYVMILNNIKDIENENNQVLIRKLLVELSSSIFNELITELSKEYPVNVDGRYFGLAN